MRFLLTGLALATAICCEAAASTLAPQWSPVANLYYQMDCLTGRGSCSTQVFEDLWQRQGWLDKEANVALGRFAQLRDRYQTDVWLPAARPPRAGLLDPPVPDLGPDPQSYYALSERLKIAALESETIADLKENLMLVMTPADGAALAAQVAHFLPGFERWWTAEAQPAISASGDDLALLLAQEVAPFLDAAITFYGHGGTDVTARLKLNLIFRPAGPGGTNGQQIENHSVVEVVPGEAAENRIGVVVHELAHYLFGEASEAWHRQRLEGAVNAGSPAAAGALGLMDEALATAVGNGALEQRLRPPPAFENYRATPLSFYNDPQIDAAAKLILDKTQDYLRRGAVLDGDFVAFYFAQVVAALAQPLDTLERRLAVTNVVVGDPALAPLWSALRSALGTRSVWTYGPDDDLKSSILVRHPYLHGVVLARPDQLPDLLQALQETALSASTLPGACTLKRRSGPGLLYLVPVNELPEATALLARMRQAAPCPVPEGAALQT